LSGIEIEDVLMIEDGTFVFVSSGADFIPINVAGNVDESLGGEHGEGDEQKDHHGTSRRRRSSSEAGSTGHGSTKAPGSPGRGMGGIPTSVGGYIVGALLGRGGFGEVRDTQEIASLLTVHTA